MNAALHARLASSSGSEEAGVIPAEDAVDALRTIFLAKRQDGEVSGEGGPSVLPPVAAAAAAATEVEVRGEAPIDGPSPVAAPAPIESPYPTPLPSVAPIGPVLAETEGLLAEDHAYGLDLRQPSSPKPAHTPRPSGDVPAPAPTSRRDRRREKKQRKQAKPDQVDRTSAIMEAQFAQMSPAGRRLYGLEPLPDLRERERLDQDDLARMMEAGEPSDRPSDRRDA